jgi:hypothetical protein
MSASFIGIELRNVEFEDDVWGTLYVDVDSILFQKPDVDLSSENNLFFEACSYAELYEKNVVSCDQAKINEIYMKK